MRGWKGAVGSTGIILLTLALVFSGLKMVDGHAARMIAPKPVRSGPLAFADLCGDAATGLQRSLMINEIARGSLRHWMPEVDLLDIPKKEAGEFRIILIGGLGNQAVPGPHVGHFALGRLLEEKLRSAGHGNARVLNFSAYGSNTYQNYLALNLAGYFSEPLRPDLVVSYSGFNEWVIPYYIEGLPEVHCGFGENIAGRVYTSRAWEFPPSLRWVAGLFPNIMKRTELGFTIKSLWDREYFIQAGREGYKRHRHLEWTDPRDMMDRHAVPFYLNALKSIRRDNDGVPILLAWQAVAAHEFELFGDAETVLGRGFYDRMFERARSELPQDGGDWRFVNVHGEMRRLGRGVSFHPTSDDQEVIASLIAREIAAGGMGK